MGDGRVQHLEPGNGGKAPEEAVQQVDAPAQVERDGAVIPEHRAEHDLGEHAAQILIRAAQQGARHKQPAGGAVLVAVEQLGHGGNGQAPHDGKRPPHHAGTAHPVTGGDAAEDRLGNIAQKRADEEKQDDLIRAASFGEGSAFGPALAPEGQGRVGLVHALLDPAQKRHAGVDGKVGQAVLDLRPGGPAVTQAQHGQKGAHGVDGKDDQRRPQDNGDQPVGQQAIKGKQQRVAPFHRHNAQHAPQGRGPQADVAVQVKRHIAVVPPAGVAGALQNVAGHPLDDGGVHGAEDGQKEPAVIAEVPQSKADEVGTDAVQNAQRPIEDAAVLIPAPGHGGVKDLPYPAKEGVGKKQKQKRIKCHTKLLVLRRPGQAEPPGKCGV